MKLWWLIIASDQNKFALPGHKNKFILCFIKLKLCLKFVFSWSSHVDKDLKLNIPQKNRQKYFSWLEIKLFKLIDLC